MAPEGKDVVLEGARVRTLGPLMETPEATSLTLRGTAIADLAELANATKLRELWIIKPKILGDLSVLRQLPKLEALMVFLDDRVQGRQLAGTDFSGLKSVQELRLVNEDGQLPIRMSWLPALRALRIGFFTYTVQEADLAMLCSLRLPELESIEFFADDRAAWEQRLREGGADEVFGIMQGEGGRNAGIGAVRKAGRGRYRYEVAVASRNLGEVTTDAIDAVMAAIEHLPRDDRDIAIDPADDVIWLYCSRPEPLESVVRLLPDALG